MTKHKMDENQPRLAAGGCGPMKGLRVLDLTHAAAGPMCTMVLADFGAEVFKVEKPGRGDGSRHMQMSDKFNQPMVGSEYYLGLNRNKLGLGLDLSKEKGIEIAKSLAANCDILVQNLRPGTLEAKGLGYDDLIKINPGLIYCDIAAFPADGPLKDAPGMDIIAQARAGTIASTGHPGSEPVKPGPSLADLSTGLQATIGIMMALRERDTTGKGQRVAVNLYHSTMFMMSNYASLVLNTDADVEPMGSGHPQLAPYQAFEASDRWFFVGVGTNQLWRRLCEGLGLEDIQDDPRFKSNYARVKHKPELIEILAKVFSRQSMDHWLAELDRMGIPASPITTVGEAFRLEQSLGSAMVSEVDHPDYGPVGLPGLPITLNKSPAQVYRHPPRLGGDTNAILADVLGMDSDELGALGDAQVISQYGTE